MKKRIKKDLYYYLCYGEIGIIALLGIGHVDHVIKRNANVCHESQVNNTIYLNNVKELDSYLDQEITFQDVRDALRNNPNLEDNDKDLINELIDKLEEKTPYLNLKCLYENIKLLQIKRLEKTDFTTNVIGSFDRYSDEIILYNYKISLFNNNDDDNTLKHELLHTAHSLVLDTKEGSIEKNFCMQNDKTSFLKEGFICWFKNYLFPESKSFSYRDLVNDIDIFKYILGVNDKELITLFTEGNYKDILNSNVMHLDDLEIEELINICDKEYNMIQYNKSGSLTTYELTRKYDLLLKACINSHQDDMNVDTVYQIQNLLSDSYNYYNIIEIPNFRENLLKQAISALPRKNNNIKITDFYGKRINYCDFNNLVLIYNKNGTGIFTYIIGEEYQDTNQQTTYYVDDDFITYNKNNDNKIFRLSDVAKTLLPTDELSLIDIGDYLEEKKKSNSKTKVYKKK